MSIVEAPQPMGEMLPACVVDDLWLRFHSQTFSCELWKR